VPQLFLQRRSKKKLSSSFEHSIIILEDSMIHVSDADMLLFLSELIKRGGATNTGSSTPQASDADTAT
jgi:hypothetical protein